MQRLPASEIMSVPVVSVGPEASVPQAVHLMRTHGISGLPVVEEGVLVGVVTEGDVLLKAAGVGGLPELAYSRGPSHDLERQRASRVGDLMVRDVVTATEDTPVHQIACLMNRHGINRVPIVREEALVGIVTRSDILAIFDRPATALLADVRSALSENLLMDPARFDIVVKDGVVWLSGEVPDVRDIHLIETFIAQIDGISGVDVTGLHQRTGAA